MFNRPITITIEPRKVFVRGLGIWAGVWLFDGWIKPRMLNWLDEWGKIHPQNRRSGGENAS